MKTILKKIFFQLFSFSLLGLASSLCFVRHSV